MALMGGTIVTWLEKTLKFVDAAVAGLAAG